MQRTFLIIKIKEKKKKTKKEEEKTEEGSKKGGEVPPNIPISTPKGRSENPKASSEPRSIQRPRRGRGRQRSEERRRSPPISSSVAVEATEAARSAAPSEERYGKQQNMLANQGQTSVTMEMLQKCLQVVQDSQGQIEKKLDDNIKKTNRHTDKITTLTRNAIHALTEKRVEEDELAGKQYDIAGIPKQATQEDKLAFVTYILQEIGLSRASVKSCDVQAMNNDTAGQEIWRLNFKDFPSKEKISDFMKSPRNWNL